MNVSMMSLWLPLVLTPILLMVVSFAVHMILKYHNSDYQKLENEDGVMDAVRASNPGPGLHSFPHCVDMKDFNDESVVEKFNRGPVGMLLILPNGMPAMGKLMGIQFLYFALTGVLVAYIASLGLAPGDSYYEVFRFVMTATFLAFGWGVVPYSIWYGFQWSVTAKYLLDAVIYGAVVGGAFAGFWPPA